MLDEVYLSASGTGGTATADIITGSAQAATMVAQTISNIIDQGKRRKFEQSLASLSNQQQVELNEKMLAATTETQRLQILTQSLEGFAKENERRQKLQKTVMFGIAGTLAIALLVVAFFTLKTKTENA